MLNRKHPILVALAGGLFGYGIAVAQLNAMDPVLAAPHIYENVLENDRVRVLKVTERNGETPPIHSHPDTLIVHLSPCAWMEQASDGSRQMQSFRLANTALGSGPVTDCQRSMTHAETSLTECDKRGNLISRPD